MSWKDAVVIVRDLGFPVAVAGFVLWRLDPLLRELLGLLREVRAEIQALRQGVYYPPHPPEPS